MTDIVVSVQDYLNKNKQKIQAAMPSGANFDRFARVAVNAISTTPQLQRCSIQSLFLSIVQALSIGIEPNGPTQEGYLVPFKGHASFMPSYRGLISLARRSGLIRSIYADVIHENDEYNIERGTKPSIFHKVDLTKDRGKIVAYYAVMVDKDGNTDFEVMTPDEIESIRNKSKAKDSGPWQTDYEEMAKKTVIKRLLKRAPMSVENNLLAKAVEADHKAAMGEAQDIIDIEGIEVPPDEPQKASRFEDNKIAGELL